MSESKTLPLQRPVPLSDSAADLIRKAIVEGDFMLGDPLTEAVLTRRLGISKTPIREALSQLKQESPVNTIAQRGTFVFALTVEDIHQLCNFRFVLESLALEWAMKHAARPLTETLSRICGDMRQAHERGEFKAYLSLDTEFHDAFFDHCRNSYLKSSYQLAGSKIATIRTHLSRGHLRTNLSLSEHEGIAAALAERSLDVAREVLRQQIFRGVEAYGELVERRRPGRTR